MKINDDGNTLGRIAALGCLAAALAVVYRVNGGKMCPLGDGSCCSGKAPVSAMDAMRAAAPGAAR